MKNTIANVLKETLASIRNAINAIAIAIAIAIRINHGFHARQAH